MKDNLNILNRRRPHFLLLMEDDQFFTKWNIMILRNGYGFDFPLNFLLMVKGLRTNLKQQEKYEW